MNPQRKRPPGRGETFDRDLPGVQRRKPSWQEDDDEIFESLNDVEDLEVGSETDDDGPWSPQPSDDEDDDDDDDEEEDDDDDD